MAETIPRRKIIKACKSRGWMIQPAALAAMHNFMKVAKDADFLEGVLNELEPHLQTTSMINEKMWHDVIESNDSMILENDNRGAIEVVNAFQTPRLVYDSMRKTFRVEEKKRPLLGSAADKISMLTQRYALVHQRILRHEIFRVHHHVYRSTQQQADTATQQHTLTPIESLLGRQNSDQEPVLVLGILTQVEEGQYYLEDATGQVLVSFVNAVTVDDFFVTEHSILLVEATFHDEILYVHRVGPPFLEQRKKTLQLLQQQVRHSHFLPSTNDLEKAKSFVILSDVHLDQPRVLTFLDGLFRSYSSYNTASELPVFCLMGNFSSKHVNAMSTRQQNALQGFEDLAMIIAKYEFLAHHAKFLFIPGPSDTKSQILPQPPLGQEIVGLNRIMQSKKVENVSWGSNPCRVRHCGKELVFFRHDVLPCMIHNNIRLPEALDSENRQPHSRMAKTILDQGHLMPIARVPIYWNYDHALSLYPLPDAMILGATSGVQDFEIYENCDSIHPGSFSQHGTYALYSMQSDDPMSDDDDDYDGSSGYPTSHVDFCQVNETEA